MARDWPVEGKPKRGRPRDPEVADRRDEVFELLAKRWTYGEIAEHQGRTAKQVQKDVTRAVQQRLQGSGAVDTYLAVHQENLRQLYRSVIETALTPGKKGQYVAHERAMAVLEREARLMGLDAETRDKLRASAMNAMSEMDKFLDAAEGLTDGEDDDLLDADPASWDGEDE